MKVLPKNINFSKTAPASVEELKDGEMVMTSDGLYARVGDQILFKDLTEAVTGIMGTYFDTGSDEGHILRSARESFGVTWVDIGGGHSPGQEDIGAVASCGNGIWLALTQWAGTHVLKSVDDGLTWEDKGALFTTYEAYAMEHIGNGIVLVGTGDPGGRIYRSIDYGDNWVDLGVQMSGNPYMWDIEYLEGGIVLAGGDSGSHLRSEDYGATWQEMGPLDAEGEQTCFVYLGNGTVIAGTDDGPYKSGDYGLNWARKGSFYPWAIVYLGNGVLVSSDGTDAWRSTDGGETWANLGTIPNVGDFWKMAHFGGNIIVGGGWGNEYLARTIDAGENWTNPPLIPNHIFTEAIASDVSKILDWIDPGFRAFIGNTTDGVIDNNSNSWESVHDAWVGDGVSTSNTQYASPYLQSDGGYLLRRTFLDLDIAIPHGKRVVDATLRIHGWAAGGVTSNLAILRGLQSLPLSIDDFGASKETLLAEVVQVSGWNQDNWNDIPLNTAGIRYLNNIQRGKIKFCVKDYDYDHLDVFLPEVDTVFGATTFSESTTPPTLLLTLEDGVFTTTTTTSIAPWHYDDFDDNSINPNWDILYSPGPSAVDEKNQRIEFLSDGLPAAILGQNRSERYFDYWILLEWNLGLPGINNTDFEMRMEDLITGDYHVTNLRATPTQWELYQEWYDGVATGYDSVVPITLGGTGNQIWLRQRLRPGDSGIRTFYTTTDPVWSGDWTEMTPTPSSSPNLTSGDHRFTFSFQNAFGGIREVWIYEFTEF